jgi:hypothetical protein
MHVAAADAPNSWTAPRWLALECARVQTDEIGIEPLDALDGVQTFVTIACDDSMTASQPDMPT